MELDWFSYFIVVAWITSITKICIERFKRKKNQSSKIMELGHSRTELVGVLGFAAIMMFQFTIIYMRQRHTDLGFKDFEILILWLSILTLYIHRYLLKDAIYDEGISIDGRYYKWSKFKTFKWHDNTLELKNNNMWQRIKIDPSKKDEAHDIVTKKLQV